MSSTIEAISGRVLEVGKNIKSLNPLIQNQKKVYMAIQDQWKRS